MTVASIASISSELRTGSLAIGSISPLARSIGGEPARRCRSDAFLLTSVRNSVSIRSSARLPVEVTEASALGASTLGATTFGGSATDCVPLVPGCAPLVARDLGSMRAEILPFWVSATSKVPSAEVYSKRTPPCASSACGALAGAISRTSVRICALVSGCFITGREESFIVTVATSPSAMTSAVALFDTRMFRKRSSCAMSVQGSNAIDQRTVDQARFI